MQICLLKIPGSRSIDARPSKTGASESEECAGRACRKLKEGSANVQEASEAYQKLLTLSLELQKRQAADQLILNLKDALRKENKILEDLGINLINQKLNLPNSVFQNFLKIIDLQENRYHIKDGNLILADASSHEKQEDILAQEMVQELNRKLDGLTHQKVIAEGKIASPERSLEITALDTEISTAAKLRNSVISSLHEAARYRKQQQEIYTQYLEKMKQLNTQHSEKK